MLALEWLDALDRTSVTLPGLHRSLSSLSAETQWLPASFATSIGGTAARRYGGTAARLPVGSVSPRCASGVHLLLVAQGRVSLLAKDSVAREQRQELAAAAAADTPSTQALVEAAVGLRRQMR
jgi:hypothetical protein